MTEIGAQFGTRCFASPAVHIVSVVRFLGLNLDIRHDLGQVGQAVLAGLG